MQAPITKKALLRKREFEVLFPVCETNESTLLEFAFVSENTFRKACPNKGSTQISVYIEDYAYTDRVVDALLSEGYNAVSPYQLGTTKQNEKLANERGIDMNDASLEELDALWDEAKKIKE